ncbi:KIF-binding protein-like [Pararge aegeria]|uniref:KIF-binding protein n=3 Tax=Pararge aegeria TaxID=116150 RepID=A0A8S4R7R6_9NEOP|nr:KIF-binding protein-like [Pararge aegeria]CAH2232692.1 jg5317 [Pararge aegeria aegeria]
MIIPTGMSAKEIVNDLKENYAKVRRLLDEDSKNDPEEEPYFSKYKAKEILKNMYGVLCNMQEAGSGLTKVQIDALKGIVLLSIGTIDMETDEYTSCEKALKEAEEVLLPSALAPEVIILLLNVLNNLGLLWSFRGQPEKAKGYLLSSKKICEDFKATLLMPVPIETILNIVTPKEETSLMDFMSLEKAHTLTLYYLAQVYGALNECVKAAIYCHVTLRRQLMYNDYDPIEWALNSATLSQFFVEQNGFYQSRYHLSAASTILDQYETELLESEIHDEEYLARKETFKHRSADVARCWVKYCLLLMSASKDRLMSDAESVTDAITDLSNLTLEDDENICGGDMKRLKFLDLNVSKYEEKITDKYLLTYEDAREVFICCQRWLNIAKDYYKPDTLASDHIELVQDWSQSYAYLAFFEEDDERRAKMYKRRVDMLEDLLKELNPTYYLLYCRQLWYELGQVYSEILNIKLEKLNKLKEKPTPHLLKKINMLCEKSIESYDNFIASVKDKNGVMPIRLDSDVVKPAINAYVHIGRNSMKRIAVDKNTHLSYVKKSYESYQGVVDICKNDPEAAKMMKEEYALCQEMVNILPLKIKKLEKDLQA